MPQNHQAHGGVAPPKPNQKFLSLVLKAIIMTVITTIFFVFLGVAAIVLLLATAAFHRHSAPSSDATNVLSSKDLRRLAKFRFSAKNRSPEDADDQTACVVCLDGFREGQWCRKLAGCGHIFHRRCVDAWLVKVPSCPICRAQVRQEERKPSWGFGWRDDLRI